jgi:hypothetical protein
MPAHRLQCHILCGRLSVNNYFTCSFFLYNLLATSYINAFVAIAPKMGQRTTTARTFATMPLHFETAQLCKIAKSMPCFALLLLRMEQGVACALTNDLLQPIKCSRHSCEHRCLFNFVICPILIL